MIDISNIETCGWEAAIRGMRNSYASWDKSDSEYEELTQITPDGRGVVKTGEKRFHLGPNDLILATKLARAGGAEAKFRRMIHVSFDILAPLYWWKEFDTYKVGIVSNSTSTMHSIMKKEFIPDDFSHEHLFELRKIESPVAINVNGEECYYSPKYFITMTCEMMNFYRKLYLETEDPKLKKEYWWQIIQLLPSSYNQLRTVDLNYEVLSHMVKDRQNHKLDEWKTFCNFIRNNLPYADELIFPYVKRDQCAGN